MNIILNNNSMIPIYEQLTNQIKAQILDGTLKPDEGLPSVRKLSGELKISALTVKKAYDSLEKDGYVVTVHGKGTYVAAPNLELAMEARKKAAEDSLSEAIAKAKMAGLSKEDILDVLNILLEEEYDKD